MRPSARLLLGVVLALAGLALGGLWFRDSSFARVERVSVIGSGSSERQQVTAALKSAAAGMSTLRVDEKLLEEAVAPYASVAGLRVRADFPHDLRIEVREHRPVALVEWGTSSVPTTGTGRLLEGVIADELPIVRAAAPAANGRVRDAATLQALRIAAAAPPELRARAVSVEQAEEQGFKLDLRDGPDLIFGSAGAARVKWLAAARVLAAESSAGATYLDLRIPSVVAAGGVGPVTPVPDVEPQVLQAEPSTVG
jgi:cell division protein FtsQ